MFSWKSVCCNKEILQKSCKDIRQKYAENRPVKKSGKSASVIPSHGGLLHRTKGKRQSDLSCYMKGPAKRSYFSIIIGTLLLVDFYWSWLHDLVLSVFDQYNMHFSIL